MVVSPEHPIIDKYQSEIKNWDEIVAYREEAAKKSDFERAELAKDKTGVCIDGLTAVNPVNGKEIPVWISDYVSQRVVYTRSLSSFPLIEKSTSAPVDLPIQFFCETLTRSM